MAYCDIGLISTDRIVHLEKRDPFLSTKENAFECHLMKSNLFLNS